MVCLWHRNERETKSQGISLEIPDHAIPILLFVGLLSRVHIWRTMTQHALDKPGQLMGRRRNRPRGSQTSPHTAIRSP